MFEKFLSHSASTNKAEEGNIQPPRPPVAARPPMRNVEMPVHENESSAPAVARPPMSPSMSQGPMLSEVEEDIEENSVVPELERAGVVPPFPTKDESAEDALPVPEEESEEEVPTPPSFLNSAQVAARPPMSPTAMQMEQESVVEKESAPVQEEEPSEAAETPTETSSASSENPIPPHAVVMQPSIASVQEPETVRGASLHEVDFADIWFSPEGIAYVRDKDTRFALTPIETDDLDDFHTALEQGFTGMSSYAIKFAGDSYRVERINTVDGLQYNCRKMPTTTPEIETLGFAPQVVKHLTSLSRCAGLLLFAGPTGQGKTTTVSALMKRFLDTDGGFLYTIEDPPEMPLSGVYHAKNGGLGLCKQVPVENDQWGAGLRSALRSKPRYILVGEIRTPETASQCLVAATSGHLVLSTIHANGVEDALNSMIKYAASTGLDSDLVADLLARGILGVVYQRLEGTTKLKLFYQSAFANPNAQAADQMRMAIRDTNINLATFMEQQKTRMERGLPMFRE